MENIPQNRQTLSSTETNPVNPSPKTLTTPEINTQVKSLHPQKFRPLLVLLCVLFLTALGSGGYIVINHKLTLKQQPVIAIATPILLAKPLPTPILMSPLIGNYSITIKDHPSEMNQSDIYLKDKKTGQETLFTTVSDLVKEYYHNSEFNHGYVYLIRRVGGGEGSKNNTNWTDELWRYGDKGQEEKLYSVPGINFQVSDDGENIAIITTNNLVILDKFGHTLKNFNAKEYDALIPNSSITGLLAWSPQTLWLDVSFGPSLYGLLKVDLKTFAIVKYDLSKLRMGTEYNFNPALLKLAYSSYPALFDVDSEKDFINEKVKVELTIYDLTSKLEEVIATSSAKRFMPNWIDGNTLEYANPTGKGTLIKKF